MSLQTNKTMIHAIRDVYGTSQLPQIQLILPYKISCIWGSWEPLNERSRKRPWMLWSFVKEGKIYHLFSQFYSVYPVLGQWSKYIDQFASIDYPWSTLHFKTLTPAPASLWQVSGAGEISHQHVALDWSPQKLTIVNKHPPKIDQLISGQGERDH